MGSLAISGSWASRVVCGLAIAWSFLPSGRAVEAAYGINVGVGHSDNVQRSDAGKTDESIGTVGVHLSLTEQGRLLQTQLATRFEYYEYFDDSYEGDLVGDLAGNARLRLLPERLEWIFQDNFGQVRQDVLAVDTPDNREFINYFTTGPDITLGTGVNRLMLSGRYSLVTYEETELDHDRVQGSIAFVRAISQQTSLSFNVLTEAIRFDDEASVAGDYDRKEAFLRYDGGGPRTRLSVDLGYTELDGDFADSDDWVLRATLSRMVTRTSTLSLGLGREFASSADVFRQRHGLYGVAPEAIAVQQTGSPFVNEFLTLGWNFERPRTAWGVTFGRYEETYETSSEPGRRRTSLSGHLRRELGPAVGLQLFADHSRERFGTSAAEYDETRGGLILSWRLGRKLSAGFQYDRFDRDSDTSADEFTENRFWLRLSWSSGSSESAMQSPIGPSPFE